MNINTESRHRSLRTQALEVMTISAGSLMALAAIPATLADASRAAETYGICGGGIAALGAICLHRSIKNGLTMPPNGPEDPSREPSHEPTQVLLLIPGEGDVSELKAA